MSTNSIAQGEQVGVLWTRLLAERMKIFFAHRTFRWSSEAKGKAAVHCVIIGFTANEVPKRTIFEYDDPTGEPVSIAARNINPYLVDATDALLESRGSPICAVPAIGIGNKPIDGGNLLFTESEMQSFLSKEPTARPYFRPWIGSDEFINGYQRYCLWIGDVEPQALQLMPAVLERIDAVRQFRQTSKSAPTRVLAAKPTRFHVENIPSAPFLLIPKVSSERRQFIPIGFMTPDVLVSDLVFVAPGATLFHFGILSSSFHMAWMRYTCGRLESRYRYSKDIVYNNFPWPESPTDKKKQGIEQAAQGVLDARAKFPIATLADLYDPLTMPPELAKAHQALDRAVDAAYGKTNFKSDAERVAFLFELYQKYTSLLPVESKPKARRKKAAI